MKTGFRPPSLSGRCRRGQATFAGVPVMRSMRTVEMWRGGCRSNISVAAPFVWRCLTGSAVAPFPHPAHRTGQADLPHPALGQDFTPSPTTGRDQAGSGVRACSKSAFGGSLSIAFVFSNLRRGHGQTTVQGFFERDRSGPGSPILRNGSAAGFSAAAAASQVLQPKQHRERSLEWNCADRSSVVLASRCPAAFCTSSRWVLFSSAAVMKDEGEGGAH